MATTDINSLSAKPMPTPFSRRLDPEEQKPLEWIWRRIVALNKCRYTPLGDWSIDAGYCLDRWSHIDFPDRSK